MPQLPLPGPSQSEPATPDPDQDVKPAACPFGDRIAKERAARELSSKPPRPGARSQQALDQAFPRSVLLRQRQEKQKNAQRPRTAGVNPASGSERGRSFISTRSYISDLTEPPLSPTSPPPSFQHLSRPRAKSAGSAGRSPTVVPTVFPTSASPLHGAPSQAWSVSPQLEFPAQPAGQITTFSTDAYQPEPPALSSQNQYRPDSRLSDTVNPHCPPRQQIHGSAAYLLREVDRDRLAAPTTLADSKVNQYLHHSPDQGVNLPSSVVTTETVPPAESQVSRLDYSIAPPAAEQGDHYNTINIDENAPETNAPQLQFLRENCTSPVPISKQTLFLCSSDSAPKPSTGISAPDPSITINPKQPVQQFSTSFAAQPSTTPAVLQLRHTPTLPHPPPPTTTIATGSSDMASYVGNVGTLGSSGPMPGSVGMLPPAAPSRVQEKEELQRLNERFSSYIARVRQLGQAVNSVDSSAFLRSSKILEDEIVQLKAMYEGELAKLRFEHLFVCVCAYVGQGPGQK